MDAILRAETDDYGRIYILDKEIYELTDEIAQKAESSVERYRGYNPDMGNASISIVQLAIKEDLGLSIMPRTVEEMKELITTTQSSDVNWKNINSVENWAYETMQEISETFYEYDNGLKYPQKEDYEITKEYDSAMEEYDEQESEIHDEWLISSTKGSFAKELLDDIKSYESKGLFPTAKDRYSEKQRRELAKKINKIFW